MGTGAFLRRPSASVHWTGRYFSESQCRHHRGLRQFRLRASGYRSFRAPTLNELYRDFRVGNALTQANANLRPERLVGVETGFDWIGERSHASVTLF